jgi:Tol biopolymer transport system component/Ser/Thr protein kinase RdoA (MazF antagonist)
VTVPAGTTLGPYQILAPLGAGGMGEVYRAHDSRLGRDVAIKVLSPHLAATPEVRARFEREARTISQLNHPHICTLFDIGHHEGTDYLVMELLEGETLAHRLEKGPLPVAEVLALGTQIADALDRAHRAGVVHRDLKPGNVMLTKAGAKLLDFGLARAASVAAAPGALTESPTVSRPLTKEGTIVGTFQYMAPEQLEGKEADARSDLWALGCVLYEMATGKRAFEGASQASLIAAIMEHEPRPITELQPLTPPALERAVKRCLTKDPDDRWQSARDVMHELQWVVEAGAQAGMPAPMAVKRRSRRLAWLVGGALGLAAGISATTAVVQHQQRPYPVSFTRRTFQPFFVSRARFEPDGQGIVFSATPEGTDYEIFSLRPESAVPRPLGLRGARLLAVSSKGELAVLTHVKYDTWHYLPVGTLARVSPGAESPREILEHVRDADWSPDGSGLAIIREVGGRDRLEYPIGKALCESDGYLSDLRFSPRGDRIAYFDHPLKKDDRGSVKVVDFKGRVIELSRGYDSEQGLAWSPDGRRIYFFGQDPRVGVFAVTLTGKKRMALQGTSALLPFDVSRRGHWLVSREDGRHCVMVRSPGGSVERDVSWLDGSDAPHLSADGRTVLFTEQGGGPNANYAVCLKGTNGSSLVQLGQGVPAGLSPDGRWAMAIVPTSPAQVVLYPTGVGEAVKLGRGSIVAYDYVGAWLPDGRRVVLSGLETGRASRVYVQEVPSGLPRPITPEGTHLAALSPDGKHVLTHGDDGSWAVYAVDGGPPRPVPGLSVQDAVVRWSKDGRSVVVHDPYEVPSRVERVDLGTGKRDLLMVLEGGSQTGVLGINWVSVADDARAYAYSCSRTLSTLFVVEGAR